MPYNLLLLPLVGGFLFIHLTYYFRFGAQRLDGYRLLFQSAVAGIILATLARTIVVLCTISPAGPTLQSAWWVFSPFPYSGTSAVALLLGPVAAICVNLFLNREKAKDLEIRRHGNALMQLLHRAEQQRHLISITLDSRKWYVGWVTESPKLNPQEMYFRILPFTSGYRDKDTLETFRTVFYTNVLNDESLDPEQFHITIPLKDVKIANLFNDNVYNQHFADLDDAE